LDEFFSTAQLAGTEFAAERQNVKIVTNDYTKSLAEEEEASKAKMEGNWQFLKIPRRPKWKRGVTTAEELDQKERENFLQWRRELARSSFCRL